MKQEHSGIPILLSAIIFFSVSIGFLHGPKKGIAHEENFGDVMRCSKRMGKLLPQDMANFLQPLMLAHSVGMLAGAMNQCSQQAVQDLASIIVKDKNSPLTRHEKRELIFVLAHYYPKNKIIQCRLFDLMVESGVLQDHVPVLLELAQGDYYSVLPSLLSWIKLEKTRRLFKRYNIFYTYNGLVEEGLLGAIAANDYRALETLNSFGVRIDTSLASKLLLQAVYERKDLAFIPFLLNRGADINLVGPDRHTPLTKAVVNSDANMVRALLEFGADSNQIVDLAIGSAIQLAQKDSSKEIRSLLDICEPVA